MQIWEKIGGSARYRNLMNGDEKTEIPLTDGWETSHNGYVNFSTRKRSNRHPHLYVHNDKLFGPQCQEKDNCDGSVRYRINNRWYKEDQMELPFGWRCNYTHENRRFYFNEYRKEFSYELPGADETLLDGTYSNEEEMAKLKESNTVLKESTAVLKKSTTELKERIDKIEYHLHNREVVGRLEQVIAYSVMVGANISEEYFWATVGGFEERLPRSVFSLNLPQLFNFEQYGGMNEDLYDELCSLSRKFFSYKSDSHRVVHQQVLQPDELETIMADIVKRATLPGDQRNTLVESIQWVYENEKEYLKDGDINRLRQSSNVFPLAILSPYE